MKDTTLKIKSIEVDFSKTKEDDLLSGGQYVTIEGVFTLKEITFLAFLFESWGGVKKNIKPNYARKTNTNTNA